MLAFALIAIVLARERGRERLAEWRFALDCLLIVAIGAFCWGLLLFGTAPARADIHIGSYVIPILAFCACVCGLRAVLPRFAIYYVAISSVLMLAVFVPMLEPLGSGYSALAFILSAASLACFGLVVAGAKGPTGALGGVERPLLGLRPRTSGNASGT